MISVGIDVAKRTHEACFMDAEGQELGRPLRFPNTAGGVATLGDRLRRLEQPVSIALEATGHHWLALHERLTREGFPVQVVNPIQTDAYHRTTVRKVKSDRRDSWIIADFHRIGRVRPGYMPDVTILQLRELTRFRFKLVDQVGDAKRKALTILDRVFPEYERLFSDVFVVTSRQLLRTATTAEEFAGFDLEELTALLRRGSLRVHDFEDERQEAARFGVERIPGIVLRGRDRATLKFYGMPSGTEFPSFLDTIVDVSRSQTLLSQESIKSLRKVKEDARVRVFVAPTCPYSPMMARAAFQMSLVNPRVKSEVIQADEFPELAQRYNVRAVPLTVIEDRIAVPGAVPEKALVEQVLKAVQSPAAQPSDVRGPISPWAPPEPEKGEARRGSGLILP